LKKILAVIKQREIARMVQNVFKNYYYNQAEQTLLYIFQWPEWLQLVGWKISEWLSKNI